MTSAARVAAMRELFVYYRVPTSGLAAAREALLLMQRELRARFPGLVARWLARPEAADVSTWMENYSRPHAGNEGGIDAQIETAIAERAHAMEPFIDGTRHVEIFDSVDTP